MKVLHLSTHDRRGGAATAAWRLHEAQRAMGVESRMLVRTRQLESPDVSATDDGTLAAWHEQISTPWLQRRLEPDTPWFTVGCFNSFVEDHPWVRDADVLHLHWVAEWLSAEAVARLGGTGKPLFWTLHDLWPVTGGNHFAGSNSPSNDAWQTGAALPGELRDIAGREFERKHRHLAGLPLHVISPSAWLAEIVRCSRVGAGWKISVLPNGIATETFRPAERAAVRLRLELPADKVLLLFGCQALKEHRKGFTALREALQLASMDEGFRNVMDKQGVELLLFGADRPDLDGAAFPSRHLGPITGDDAMASLYQAADAFLCPALEDNLPTTVIESLACGLPVLGFATGGVPDLVRDGETGLLAPCGDAPALAACIIRFATDAALRTRMQTAARSPDPTRYSAQTQARRVLGLYGAPPRDDAQVPAASSTSGPPSVVVPCAILPGEEPWLTRAAAESVRLASEREATLRRKLDEARVKLARLKSAAAPRAAPTTKKTRWYHRWRRR